MEISEKEVAEYRDIYYEYLKPLLYMGIPENIIKDLMQNVYEKFNWTENKFLLFQRIDLMQRIEYINDCQQLLNKKSTVQIAINDNLIDTSKIFTLPELRCPIRSEERRNSN